MPEVFDSFRDGVVGSFRDCADFVCRESGIEGERFAILFIKGITSRDFISERIIRSMQKSFSRAFSGDFASALEAPTLKTPKDESDASEAIAKGEVLILTESANGFFATLANAEEAPSRSVDEPTSDVTLRGPKAGFVESGETNMALLRRYIRSPKLKFRSFTVGSVSSTTVTLAFVEGRADQKTVEEIAEKISKIEASVITDSANIAMLLDGNTNPPLPTCGSTEKVDKVASKLMSGRIAIIVDGSPFVLTLPFLFVESIQASDDYLHTPYYATFIRMLRTVAFFAAIFSPAILCVAVTYNSEVIPNEIYGIIVDSRKDIPLSFFWEIMAVLLLFELLREVGVRMPRTVGDAVGIVGSIILGNTAVETGLVSSIGVITVAFSAVCAFITPAYMYVIVLARIAMLVSAEVFGVFGLGLGIAVMLLLFCGKKSFGVPYMTPLSPISPKGLEDFIFSWPKRTLGRKESFGGKK